MSAGLLEGDTALVTGAGRGIGRGILDALSQEGARVLGADLEGAELQCDLASLENARRVAAQAIARLGKVSLFVHCASPRRQEPQTALSVSDAQWREMLGVNLDAAFATGQAPPGMTEKIPLRRFGTPAEVAAMAVAVLSERFGAYVTGASIVVDGGIALHNWIDPKE